MICSKCGKKNPNGNATCFSCGEKLSEAVAEEVRVTQNSDGSVTVTTAKAVVDAAPAQSMPGSAVTQAPSSAQNEPVVQTAQTATPTAPQAEPVVAAAEPQAAQQSSYAAPQAQAQPAAQTQPQPQPQPTPAPQPQAAPQPTPAPQPQAAQQTQTAPAQTIVYSKGCIGSAWDDISSSSGWLGRILLLGLLNIIPILNWIVPGYCMRWARQLPMGRIEQMPKSIFANRAFVNGAFWFVISLVFGLVSSIACGIVGIIPILGWIAAIAIALFMNMFTYLAAMRAAVADRLGAAFDISKLWNSMKKNPGSLLVVTIVPGLIIGAVVCIIAFIIILIAIPLVGTDILNMAYLLNDYGYGYSYGHGFDYGMYAPSDFAIAMAVINMIGMFIPAFLLIYLIGCFATAFEQVLVFRALGHWTARYASDWTTDPSIAQSMNMYPDPRV